MVKEEIINIALVTGGSRGIGAASALRLAQAGWNVAVNYKTDADAAEAVAAKCRALAVEARIFRADVADEDDVVSMFEQIDEWGALRVLVNNAGMGAAPAQRLEEMSKTRMREVFDVNVIGSMLCAREAVKRMSTKNGGSGGAIVNVSSISVKSGSPGGGMEYAASKGAIDVMTLGLSKEVAQEAIRVNAVRPGMIHTDFHERIGDPGMPARVAHLIPMQRCGEADEVASLIAWLCSDEASYTTGALIDVTGGI